MRFPWQKREAPYSDAIVEALTAASTDSESTSVRRTGALEIALGLWGRAFASAEVTPDNVTTRALTPDVLAMMGREVIRRGEVLFLLEVVEGEMTFQPACNWDVKGGASPATWTYDLELAGPSTTTMVRNVAGSRVVHVRYGSEPDKPWSGVAPLDHAKHTAKLMANLEGRLGEELGQSAGQVLGVPGNAPIEKLQDDLRKLKGRLALLESTAAGWGEGSQGAPKRDLVQQRIGANPPDALVSLRPDAARTTLATAGVPITLLADADGTALRESWRQFLHSAVVPVALIAAQELRLKLEQPELTLTFDRMFASDLSGRARAFQSLVGGGMDITKAAALAGLMESDV